MEYKILLLEDDVSLIDGLTYSLGKNGYRIDVAQTLKKAYALLEQNTYRVRVSKDTLINICFCLYLENLTRIELGFALELFDRDITDDLLCCFYPTSIWGTQLSKLLI